MHFHPRWDGTLHFTKTARQDRASGALARPVTRPAPVPAGEDRLDRIRSRVRDGFYGSPAAVELLAGCLLASGAL